MKSELIIADFLIQNGYKEDKEDKDNESDYRTFYKEGVSSIDIGNKEVVFIGESGDWLHLPVNIFAVLGALVHYRQLAVDYKHFNL